MSFLRVRTTAGAKLLVKSMSKLHDVSHVAFGKLDVGKFAQSELVSVASILPAEQEYQSVTAIASQYAGDASARLESMSKPGKPYTGFYMLVDSEYFQVAGFFRNKADALNMLEKRDDLTVLDTITFSTAEFNKHGAFPIHVVACNTASRFARATRL